MCSERPGRCAAAVRSGRAEDRRGVHRQLHDQYRPLQRCALLFISITIYYLFQKHAVLVAAAGKLLSKYDGQLPTRLWIAPPTRMDETQLISEGYYSTYGKVKRQQHHHCYCHLQLQRTECLNARRWVPARRCPAARCAWVTRLESQTSPLWCPPLQETSPTGHQNTTSVCSTVYCCLD